jgi:receptor protein-tyrosine kinase
VQDQTALGILWRGKYLIAAAALAGIVLAIIVTKVSSKVYESTALIQITSASAPGKNVDPVTEQEAAQGLATTYATVIDSEGFLDRIRSQVGGGKLSVHDLQSRIGAKPITSSSQNTTTSTNLIELSVQGSSPQRARRLANEVAHAFIDTVGRDAAQRSATAEQQLRAQIATLDTQIDRLRTASPNSGTTAEQLQSLRSARTALTNQLSDVVANGIAQGGSVALPSPPYASSSPIRPRPLLNVIAGVLLGLLVGVGLAWLRARLDRGLRSASEAERLLDVPVLASVPVRRRYVPDDPVLAEAYDVLRANLAFLSLDQTLHVLTFTSFNPREGKTSTVEGTAFAAVRGGLDVLLVDADVRTRMLSSRFGQLANPGLTDVVVGELPLDRAIVELAPGLSLLPAGRTPPNPPSLLASGRMKDVMAQLRERHALVAIDSPPVANMADAPILASLSDGVILLGRVGITDRADLRAAVTNLRHSPTPVVGVVILEPRSIDEKYYPAAARTRPVPTSVGSRS